MGIPSIVAGQDDCRNGDSQRVRFANTFTTSTGITLCGQTGWATSTGYQVGGAIGAWPTLDGAPIVRTNSSTGALIVQPAKTGLNLYAIAIEATLISGQTGTLFVVDRYCDIRATEGAAAFGAGALDATTKLAAGEFCQIMAETASGLTLGPPQWQPIFNYTNQSDVAHTSTYALNDFNANANLVFPYNPAGTPFGPILQPLAGGDMGARKVTSITIAGTVAAAPGDVVYSLVKPVLSIPLSVVGVPLGRDLIAQQMPMNLRSDPCLVLYYMPIGTAANTVIQGEIRILSA